MRLAYLLSASNHIISNNLLEKCVLRFLVNKSIAILQIHTIQIKARSFIISDLLACDISDEIKLFI